MIMQLVRMGVRAFKRKEAILSKHHDGERRSLGSVCLYFEIFIIIRDGQYYHNCLAELL